MGLVFFLRGGGGCFLESLVQVCTAFVVGGREDGVCLFPELEKLLKERDAYEYEQGCGRVCLVMQTQPFLGLIGIIREG